MLNQFNYLKKNSSELGYFQTIVNFRFLNSPNIAEVPSIAQYITKSTQVTLFFNEFLLRLNQSNLISKLKKASSDDFCQHDGNKCMINIPYIQVVFGQFLSTCLISISAYFAQNSHIFIQITRGDQKYLHQGLTFPSKSDWEHNWEVLVYSQQLFIVAGNSPVFLIFWQIWTKFDHIWFIFGQILQDFMSIFTNLIKNF
ncbi:Hypothetical_protein [Hexamita inflata]|uniref:Hypothetical_protein n=1 Tax=Hexamita inflata TaxID=28002 RepID=A0AA86R087_9EUKA|nr:Hypothetical protein HINF_LOCUS55460 [Hexamita inflata]